MIDYSFQEEKNWLKVCGMTIQIIAASVHLSQGGKKTTNHNTSNGNVGNSELSLAETLESCTVLLGETLKECSKCQKSIQVCFWHKIFLKYFIINSCKKKDDITLFSVYFSCIAYCYGDILIFFFLVPHSGSIQNSVITVFTVWLR